MKLKYIYLFLIISIILLILHYQRNKYPLYKFLDDNGYLIIPNGISENQCGKLLDLINNELKNKNKVEGEINNPTNRKDLLLPLNELTINTIKKIYTNYSSLWNKITPNTILAECSSFLSYPNSKSQNWHADTENNKNKANLITIGIALVDINNNMGPLEVYPESNKLDDKDLIKLGKHKIDTYKNNFLEDVGYERKKLSCKKGSIIIWSSTIYHRGGANISNKIRPMFYFSFLGGDKVQPIGGTYSLKKNYNTHICLKSI